jgi:hypothetical protein
MSEVRRLPTASDKIAPRSGSEGVAAAGGRYGRYRWRALHPDQHWTTYSFGLPYENGNFGDARDVQQTEHTYSCDEMQVLIPKTYPRGTAVLERARLE